MTSEETTAAAKALLEKNAAKPSFNVSIDNPKDCSRAITAFRKLGCKVKVMNDGALLTVTKRAN
ncbi:MAG TPA: hypothetical protein VGE01_12615 [Fimbriimonas sp.]